jgi:hypothetical protein
MNDDNRGRRMNRGREEWIEEEIEGGSQEYRCIR